MAFVHARQRWKISPAADGHKEVDWNNSLTNGLVALIVPGPILALRNLVSGSPVVYGTTNATTAYEKSGRVFKHNATQSTNYVQLGTRKIVAASSTGWTLGTFHAWDDGVQIIASLAPSGGAPDVNLIGLIGAKFADKPYIECWGSGGTPTLDGSTTRHSAGTPFIGGWDGSNIWCATIDSYSSAANTHAPDRDADALWIPLKLGNIGGSVTPYTGIIAAWDKPMTKAAGTEFCKNPWQLLRQQERRIYVNTAAAGGTFKAAWAVQNNSVVGVGVH